MKKNAKADKIYAIKIIMKMNKNQKPAYTPEDTPLQRHATDDQIAILRKIIKKEEEKQVLKNEIIEEIREEQKKQKLPEEKRRPHCVVEKNWGYLKFGKFGEKIKIGRPNSRPFRLLQCLLEPFGMAKTIEAVYEAIMLPKDKNDADLSGWDTYKKKNKQISIIQNSAIKELQKGNKLQNKLKFEFDDTKSKIWIKSTA